MSAQEQAQGKAQEKPKAVRQQCALCGAFLRRPKDDESRVICGRCGTEWQ